MSYQGKRHYAYIDVLERLSLERETMRLEMRGRYRGASGEERARSHRRRKSLKERELRAEALRRQEALEQMRQDELRKRELRSMVRWSGASLEEGSPRKRRLERGRKARRTSEGELEELARRLRPHVPDSLRSHVSDYRRPCASLPCWSAPAGTWGPMSPSDPAMLGLAAMIDSGELNFHGGISHRLGPMATLKMVSASSVFGEPQYYRDGSRARATALGGLDPIEDAHTRLALSLLDPLKGSTTAEVMERAIDAALSTDYGATLEWAIELREHYLMRLNPQVILVRAAMHPGRPAWTQGHPGEFARIAERVMRRGDDVTNQVQYWLWGHGGKQGIPAILKRAWARRVGTMGSYAMAKYGNAGIGLVDVVRICHAKGPLVDTLMREGRVPMPEGQSTWERLRSSGMGWDDILATIRMPHMALMRNLRGIFAEVEDPEVREKALALLKRGVRGGRQFPFRYLSAWKAAEAERASWTCQVQDALEECMGIACENLPNLRGRSAFLTDVSGSMWSTFTSEFGSVEMSEIANLCSVIGATRADEGVVFPFADRMARVAVHKDGGVLEQARLVDVVGSSCGGGTENPFLLFLTDALAREEHWDNIFVYSDMQAGSMRTYGGPAASSVELVEYYRRRVNPKVNVYCIQLGGYANSLAPEHQYRMTNLYGWTGKELLFADAVNRAWDEAECDMPGQS